MVVDRRRMEAVGGWRKRRIRPARGSETWKRETKRGNQFLGRYSNRGRTISFPRGNAMDKYTCGSVSFYRCAPISHWEFTGARVLSSSIPPNIFFFFNYFLAANALLLPVSTLTAVINRWMMIPSLEQVWKRGFLCFTELEWKGKWNFFFSPRKNRIRNHWSRA